MKFGKQWKTLENSKKSSQHSTPPSLLSSLKNKRWKPPINFALSLSPMSSTNSFLNSLRTDWNPPPLSHISKADMICGRKTNHRPPLSHFSKEDMICGRKANHRPYHPNAWTYPLSPFLQESRNSHQIRPLQIIWHPELELHSHHSGCVWFQRNLDTMDSLFTLHGLIFYVG